MTSLDIFGGQPGPWSGGYGTGLGLGSAGQNSAYGPYRDGYRFSPQAPDSGLSTAGAILGIAGAFTNAIGSFYSVHAQKSALKSQALSLEFEQTMANLNARAAEREAQSTLSAGQREIGRRTLVAGQEKASAQASAAARGVAGGSVAEVEASHDLIKEIDVHDIRLNATRAANAARTQAVNQRNQALISGVSAQNLYRTAGSLQPGLSLLGGANRVASVWLEQQRFRERGYRPRSGY